MAAYYLGLSLVWWFPSLLPSGWWEAWYGSPPVEVFLPQSLQARPLCFGCTALEAPPGMPGFFHSWRGMRFTFPLGALVFTLMMAASAFNVISGRGVRWKGRRYHPIIANHDAIFWQNYLNEIFCI